MRCLRTVVVLAVVAALTLGSAGSALAGGPPDDNPGKGPQDHGKRHGFYGNVTAVGDGNITLVTNQGWTVDLTLPATDARYKMPSVTKGWEANSLDDFVEGYLGGNITALEGRRVAVLAQEVVGSPEEGFDGVAKRLLVLPDPRARVRLHAHHTGVVTEFTEEKIVITDANSESHEFALNGTVYRPDGAAIAEGSFVTVITGGQPKLGDPQVMPSAKAIVLHKGLPDWWTS